MHFQKDVISADLPNLAQDGFRSVGHFKRSIAACLATDRGKLSNLKCPDNDRRTDLADNGRGRCDDVPAIL